MFYCHVSVKVKYEIYAANKVSKTLVPRDTRLLISLAPWIIVWHTSIDIVILDSNSRWLLDVGNTAKSEQ